MKSAEKTARNRLICPITVFMPLFTTPLSTTVELKRTNYNLVGVCVCVQQHFYLLNVGKGTPVTCRRETFLVRLYSNVRQKRLKRADLESISKPTTSTVGRQRGNAVLCPTSNGASVISVAPMAPHTPLNKDGTTTRVSNCIFLIDRKDHATTIV